KRNCAFKSAGGARDVSDLAKGLAGCGTGPSLRVTDSDGEAALCSDEWRHGPTVQQLALPAVTALEHRWPVGEAGAEDKLDIEDLWPIAGPWVPDIQKLI